MQYSKRFHALTLSILACVFFSGSSLTVPAAEDGFQLYVEACKRSLTISSAQAEFTCLWKRKDQSGTLIGESHLSARGLFKGCHPFLTDDRKANLYLWETKQLKDTGMSEPAISVLCVGNPEFMIGKDGKLRQDRINMVGKDVEEYLCLSRIANAIFSINSHPRWTPQFQLFGRMQGNLAQKSFWLLTAAEGRKKPAYSLKGLAALKKDGQENKISYTITGNTSYDGTNQATIIEVLRDGKTIGRYWIDPSRDYICPLIQIISSGKVTSEYISSGYICEKSSGLWYPAKYTYNHYYSEAVNGFQELTLVPDSLSLNRSLPDGLFALDVPSGERVFDSRIGGETVFVAKDNGALSFTKGDIDLRSFPWLEEKGTAYSGDRTIKVPPKFSAARIFFICSGILLILAAFSIILYRKWKGR